MRESKVLLLSLALFSALFDVQAQTPRRARTSRTPVISARSPRVKPEASARSGVLRLRILPQPLAGQSSDLASFSTSLFVDGQECSFIHVQAALQGTARSDLFAVNNTVGVVQHVSALRDKNLMQLTQLQRSLPSNKAIAGQQRPFGASHELYDYQVEALVQKTCSALALRTGSAEYCAGVVDFNFPMKEDRFEGPVAKEFAQNTIIASFREVVSSQGFMNRLRSGRLNKDELEVLREFYKLYKFSKRNQISYCRLLRAFKDRKTLIIPWLEEPGHWVCRCFVPEARGGVAIIDFDSRGLSARSISSQKTFFNTMQNFIRELKSVSFLKQIFGRKYKAR